MTTHVEGVGRLELEQSHTPHDSTERSLRTRPLPAEERRRAAHGWLGRTPLARGLRSCVALRASEQGAAVVDDGQGVVELDPVVIGVDKMSQSGVRVLEGSMGGVPWLEGW